MNENSEDKLINLEINNTNMTIQLKANSIYTIVEEK